MIWPTDDPTGTHPADGWPDERDDLPPIDMEPAGSPESYRQRAEDRLQEEAPRSGPCAEWEEVEPWWI